MESERNRSYFVAEGAKNRDTWKKASGDDESNIGYNPKKDSLNLNLYATGKFDDVIRYQQPGWIWKKADGEYEPEDEESVEGEGEEASFPEEEFAQDELPKFRQLVRAKKLEMKAQYGKAHFATRRECKNVPYPGTCYKQVCAFGKCANVPYPCTKYKEVCINVPYWVWGWRKKWREFKQGGGLSQLKMISKGMTPTPGTGTTTPTGPTPSNPRGSGRISGEEAVLETVKKDDGGVDIQEASMGKNIFLGIIIIGFAVGAVKLFK